MFSLTKRESGDYFGAKSPVIELSPKDFDSVKTYKLKSKKCTMIFFYAPWCGYCKRSKELWTKLASSIAFADVAAFNCEKHKGHVMKMNQDHPSKAFIKSYPTIILYKNGEPHKTFTEERTFENLMTAAMDCRSNDL